MSPRNSSQDSGSKRPELLVSEILKVVFELQGIKCESAVLLRWRVIGDTILPQPITTLRDFVSLFRDGSYQLALTNVTIQGVQENPFEISAINVEVSFENGKWSDPRVYTDEEPVEPEQATAQALHARLDKVKTNIRNILELIPLLLRIAQGMRDLFS